MLKEDVDDEGQQLPTSSSEEELPDADRTAEQLDQIDLNKKEDGITVECQLRNLFSKWSEAQAHNEKLEKQANDYREQLIRTIRERDLNEELLKNVRQEQAGKLAELDRKVLDLESQLKVTKDRAAAQEAHYHSTTKDLTSKFNAQVAQLTKKQEAAEKDKNEAVVKYAMKEAEIMRLSDDIKKKVDDNKKVRAELDELKRSADVEKLAELEKQRQSLSVELEKVKHERFDLENRLKIAEKRAEVAQSSANEQRQQNEVLRRQMLQIKEEKATSQEQIKLLELRIQTEGERKYLEDEEKSRALNEREEIYRNVVEEVARTKKLNRELAEKIEELSRENGTGRAKINSLEEQLSKGQNELETALKELENLRGIESQVNSSLEEAKECREAKIIAESDRDTAESEAEECRRQAERLLELTEQLTRKNTELAAQMENLREEKTTFDDRILEAESNLAAARQKQLNAETSKLEVVAKFESEIRELQASLTAQKEKTSKLERQLEDEVNTAIVYKKKAAANLKELKTELSQLRKTQLNIPTPEIVVDLPSRSSGSRSRASSITSVDQIGKSSEASFNQQSPQSPQEELSHYQQAMIEKIVKLQKMLARRNEKIDFLEEHVKQCLEELQKKTKIIQYYALREEASLLVPDDKDMKKVPISRTTAVAYSLMGSMWSTGSDKSALQLATEVNSRLQAVLEDTLLKNIALKTSIDKLGEEIARLSRENRQLTLKQ